MSSSHLFGFTGNPDDPPVELWEARNSAGTGQVLYSTGRAAWQHAHHASYNIDTIEEWYAASVDEHSGMAFHDRVMAQLVGDGLVILDPVAQALPKVIRAWLDAHADLQKGWTNHWGAIANVFEAAAGAGGYVAYGLWLTSVTDNPFGQWVEAGWNRFYEWKPAHWAVGPLDQYPQFDEAMLDLLREMSPDTGNPPTADHWRGLDLPRTEVLRGQGDEYLLGRVIERLASQDLSKQWFVEAYLLIAGSEGCHPAPNIDDSVEFLHSKFAETLNTSGFNRTSMDWWRNLVIDAAMCAHRLHNLDAALGRTDRAELPD